MFEACSSPDDLCSDLQVSIFCTTVGRKAYRFRYTTNPATSRYETLLGYLGYEFLLSRGGPISEIRIINITVYDSLSEMVNPQALARVKVRNQDVLIITVDPPAPAPTFSVYEDERPGRTCNLYNVQVQRLDGTTPGPGEIIYNITGGNIGDVFGINEEGTIYLNGELDREMMAQYNLVVSARIRGADEDTTASAMLIADVIDVNDNYPITAESYSVNVSEGVANMQVVHVIATDADEGTNAELTYLLLGIGAELFEVDNNGVVRTRIALNKTIDDYYLLVMIITDRGEIYLSTHTVINIYVITPPPSDLAFNPIVEPMVLESTAVGTEILTVSAFEVGGSGDTTFIRYRFVNIVSTTTGLAEVPPPFAVNGETGVITVNSPLDAERSEEYLANIEAYSIRTLFPPRSAFENITFDILDSNELPPMFVNAPYSIDVAENTAVGTSVSRLVAVDSDAMNQGLTYSLGTPVPVGLPLTITQTGDVVVSDVIDYERNTMFNFTVVVQDNPTSSMPSLSATAQVMVNVLDRNDNAPEFIGTPYNVSVRETEPNGYTVLEFNTVDADSTFNSQVSYSVEGLTGTPFCLIDRAIQVCDAASLTSIESDTLFLLEIVATNPPGTGSTVEQVTREAVEIELILINEHDPEFASNNINHVGFIEEHCGRGYGRNCLGIVVYNFGNAATDNDGGLGGELTFSLQTTGVPFSLNSTSGVLTILGRIDREARDTYTLIIQVQDMGDVFGTVRSSLANITIPITDIDDNLPVFVPPYVFNVTESMTENRQVFGRIMVEDPDVNNEYIFNVLSDLDPPVTQGCIRGSSIGPDNYLPIMLNENTGELHFCESIDFESGQTTFDFTVQVIDFRLVTTRDIIQQSILRTFTVNVVDVNDNPPAFVNDPYIFYQNENIAARSLVGSIRAQDSDFGLNARLLFGVINGSTTVDCNSGVPFYVEKTSDEMAAIRNCQPLDYEVAQVYTFTVQVCDSALVSLCDDAIITVRVLDRNDNPPQFVPDNKYVAQINETDSSDMMTAVVTVQVTDADSPPNSISNFTILSPSSPFGLRAITDNSAVIFVEDTDAIDFESGTTSHVIQIQAVNAPVDSSDVVQSATATVTITIVDINDNAPMIMPPFEFSARENQPRGTKVGCVRARDADSGVRGDLTYFVGSADASSDCFPGDLFIINATSGCITTCDTLDYESDTSHNFVVVVCDSSVQQICSNMTFTVNVIDLNDNAPVYTEDPFIVDVNENIAINSRVVVISSTDADSPANSAVRYSFPNTSGPFDINAVTGEVTYNGVGDIDFEGPTRTYIIHVQGFNQPFIFGDITQRSDVALVVNIIDRNDEPPVFPQPTDTVSISEHTPASTEIYTLSTTDQDSLANSAVRYEIVEAGSPFAIQGNRVVVINSNAIDYDFPASVRDYVLTIRAINDPAVSNDVTQTSTFTLTIAVTDINDNAPQCIGRDAFILTEFSEVSTSLVRVMANDIDDGFNGNAGLQFFVTVNDADSSGSGFGSGDPLCSEDLPFRIDPDSGYISICVPLDYETTNAYSVNVTVCDMGFPRLCTICPIMFSVMDENDNNPIIHQPLEFNVSELQPIGIEIGCVNATDADSGQNGVIDFAFSSECSSALPFTINETTGCIVICAPLDFETVPVYSFDVIATDNGSGKLNDTNVITVSVINENDHAPMFTSPAFAQVEEEAANEVVIIVSAMDIDAPPFNVFTFELVDDAGGSFEIESQTGEVKTTIALDREEQSTYSIDVRVFDGRNENLQTILIELLDINDNPPEYLGDPSYSFLENMMFELVLVFRDNDTGNNSLLNYDVNDHRFSISNNGLLRNVENLDRDPGTGGVPTFMLQVTVTDSGEEFFETSIMLSITLIDENDNAPIPQPPFMADVVDGSPVGTEVFTITAVDYDAGINAEIVFSLAEPSNDFAVDSTTGVVTLIRPVPLFLDKAERLLLSVNISDRGMPTLINNMEYAVFIVSALPVFVDTSYSFAVDENIFNSTIGIVMAEDRDLDALNDDFYFGIDGVSPYDPGFTIISRRTNGTLLSPSNYFDYEDATDFNISVTVGRINLTEVVDDRAYIIVSLNDINDNVPRLSPLNISADLREDAQTGDIVATAVAIDFDTGVGGQLTYNLSGSGAEYFGFDMVGNLYLNTNVVIDFESQMSYTFMYQACDGGVPKLCSEPGYVFLEVINVDDIPPTFDPNVYEIMISEAFGANTLILYINFSDPDTPLADIILTLQPPQDHFQILLLSGVGALTTTDLPLDRETLGMHTFTVIATDTAGASASASVSILLLDENDQRPFVDTNNLVVTYAEGGAPVFPADGLNIVDEDDVSLYPLTRLSVSLHPSPTSLQTYPNPGGICNHANRSLLFDNNTHSICGLNGCIYLLQADQVVIPLQGSQVDGILELPRQQDIARNPAILLDGDQFENFTITIWVRFTSRVSGNVFEVQSGNDNIFGVSVDMDGSLQVIVNPTPTTTTVLLDTGPLSTHNGEWHQLALIKEERSLTMFFDCEIVQRSIIAIDTAFTRADFTSASFFLGNRLGSGFYAEFYFCNSITSQSHICCTLNCGETLDVLSPTADIEATVNLRTRSVELEYTGNASSASLTQLQEAMQKIAYTNILDEPHPLDRGLFFSVYDRVGPSDVESVVILRPVLINDQRPVIDLNGPAAGINYETQFDETSPGAVIIGADAILYDEDSGYWPVNRVVVELDGTTTSLESLIVAPGLSPLNITSLRNETRIEIVSNDPQVEYFPSDFIDALGLIRYVDRTEEPMQFTRPITITVYDQGATFVNDPVAITSVTITPSNDMPVLDLNTGNSASLNTSVVYEERSGRVLLLQGNTQSITDPDSVHGSRATFVFTQRPDGEQEVLQVDSSSLPPVAVSSLVHNFDLTTGMLTLEGNYNFDTWLLIFRAVEYTNNNLNPSEIALHEIAVTIHDDRGLESRPAFIQINIRLFNNPPQIFVGGGNQLDYRTTFTEDGDCIPITSPNITVLDLDSPGIRSLSISLSGTTEDSSSEFLEIIGTPRLENAFFLGRRSITIVLTDNAPARYEAALRRVVYCNLADEPDETSQREVRFTATDAGLITSSGTNLGSAMSEISKTTIDIIRINDRPELFFEPLNNVSIRGVPTQIIDPDTIEIRDSDDTLFNILRIYIVNHQDAADNEIIEFARQLPESTVSVGPLPGPNREILYRVTFRDAGADRSRVIETISNVRYNNRASRITVDPPREICLTITDFDLTSERSCVRVTISPPNNFDPVFRPTSTSFTFMETNNSIDVAFLIATDDDPGLEGTISYGISQVISYNFLTGRTVITTNNGLFAINSDGDITAPNGLDAEEYTRHDITVVASDMGNPVRSAQLMLRVDVFDINDVAPMFTGTPYVATPQREQQSPPRFVYRVTAVDGDAASTNNEIQRYGLENYQSLFSIDSTGTIQSTVLLDAEVQSQYLLNVSAVDSGSPPLTGYTTVLLNLLDFNDNPAEINQLSPAIHVIDGSPTSIGPAIRIEDGDLDPPAINQLSVMLTPNSMDSSRTYDQCLDQCQETRIQEANLLPPAIDLLARATFQQDQSEPSGQVNFRRTQVGRGGCTAWELQRGSDANRENDGYGRIARGDLPDTFASGDFTLSFVLTPTAEGYVIVIPDQTNPSLQPGSVERVFAVWLRRYDFRFYYTHSGDPSRSRAVFTVRGTNIGEFFNPNIPSTQTRHFTVIVRSSPPIVELYIDCQYFGLAQLNGAVLSPPLNIDVFIGQSKPNPTRGGRLAGVISNFFYHPTAINPTQLLNFCSCGLEAIRPPPLPSSINANIEGDTRITFNPSSGLIPLNDALTVLRGITYENTFPSPTLNPNRELRFTVREETGIEGTTIGSVKLVASDNNAPVIDLTGPGLAGINYQTGFVEDASPMSVAPSVRISRDVQDSVTPTFARVIVELTNPIDANETLSATSSNSYITVDISSDRHTVVVTGPGIEADFVAVLQTVTYENTNNNPTINPARVISFTVVDTEGRMNNPLANTTVLLTAVNDPPLVSLASVLGDVIDTVQFEEGSSGVLLAPNVLVFDVDNTELLSASVQLLSPNPLTDELVITTMATPAITGSYNSTTGVLQLMGRASLADYVSILSTVTFVSTDSPLLDINGNPVFNATRVVTVVVSDGLLQSEMARVIIQFVPVNDPPIIILNSTLVQFRDGDLYIFIAPNVEITDIDTRNLFSMTVEIAIQGAQRDQELLRIGDVELEGRQLVFGSNTTEGFTDILRRIRYVNFEAEPTPNNRIIDVEVCDASTSCTEMTIVVEIVDINDNPPEFSQLEYIFPATEDVPVGFTVGSVTVVDRDSVPGDPVFSMDTSDYPFDLRQEHTMVHIVTTRQLDFETTVTYAFRVIASDGVNQDVANVTINVMDVNEQPLITLDTPAPSIVIGPGSESPLILVDIVISDPDFGDSVDMAQLSLRNVPDGSDETLGWNVISGYSFTETNDGEFLLTNETSSVSLAEALQSVTYIAGLTVVDLTEIRHVAVTVFDQDGLRSDESVINISLASIPEFTSEVYPVSLLEGVVHQNFLQITASVENGGDVIEYAVDQGRGVTINRLTGFLSLVRPLDHEVERFLTFSVYAIDALPPARTGTATVNITVIDVNDVRPVISGVNNITVNTGVPVNPFPNIAVTDPDTIGQILRANVTVVGVSRPQRSPFSGRVCVDEYNVIRKMREVCALSSASSIDLIESISLLANAALIRDTFSNLILTNTPGAGYSVVNADFSSFQGVLNEFTFAVWLAPITSGYIAYFGTPDATERYLAIYYDNSDSQLIVTLKREGLSGLSAQVRVNFQLQSSLSDGNFHFIMIQYVQRNLVCVVDGVRVNSMAVIYKEQPFIGEVYGESVV